MPIFKKVNRGFFKKWNPKMAYVLGFFTADGNMIRNRRGGYFISLEITDRGLLEEIKSVLGSNHRIWVRERKKANSKWKDAYRLQIGSKEIFNDLLRLGITPCKSKTINLPDVPHRYLADFLRGYFDGDGYVQVGYFRKSDRKNKSFAFRTIFTSGSRLFLEALKKKLNEAVETTGSMWGKKDEYAWKLSYSSNDSRKLFRFMYKDNNTENLIYLNRKYKIFLSAGVA